MQRRLRFRPHRARARPYSLLEEEGDCRLYTGRYFCVCDPDQQCVDGACRPYPSFVPVGDVAIDGLGERRHLLFDDSVHWYRGEPDGTSDGMIRSDAAVTSEGGRVEVVAAVETLFWATH